MKKLLILSIFFFSLIYSQENRINSAHLIMRDGIFYDKNEFLVTDTPPPYSGEVVTINETSSSIDYGLYVRSEYSVLKGKRHGNYKVWYRSGVLEDDKNYIDGKLHGLYRSYFDTVDNTIVLREDKNYVDGKLHGLYRAYFKDGTIRVEGSYKDGKLDGVWIHYTRLGKVESRKNWENGKQNNTGPRKW